MRFSGYSRLIPCSLYKVQGLEESCFWAYGGQTAGGGMLPFLDIKTMQNATPTPD